MYNISHRSILAQHEGVQSASYLKALNIQLNNMLNNMFYFKLIALISRGLNGQCQGLGITGTEICSNKTLNFFKLISVY